MEAICQNEDCDRGSWRLRKDPDDYSGKGPACPECGSTNVTFNDPNPDSDPQPEAGQQPQRRSQQSHPPQRGDNGQSGVPATVQQGAQLGGLLTALNSPDPEEQARARGGIIEAVGGALLQVGQQAKQRDVENAQRAKNPQGDVSVAHHYESCPECNQQLIEIPRGEVFQCPGCGTYLEYEE